MTTPSFRTGEFKPFKALSRVHLGKFETDIGEGTIIYTDGQTVKIGQQGEALQLPTIKAAIKQGWFQDLNDPNAPTTYKPQHAKIRIGPTEGDAKPYEREKQMKTLGGDDIQVAQHEHRIAVEFDGSVPGSQNADDLSTLADATAGEPHIPPTIDAHGNEITPTVGGAEGAAQRLAARKAQLAAASAPAAAPVASADHEVNADFEWNKGRHWKQRVSGAVAAAEVPGDINRILETETAKVAKLIRDELGLEDGEFM